MAESSSGSGGGSGFWKWIGGIVTAVLVPVLVYYLTRTPPPPPPPVAQTEFDGFVQDATSHNLIAGAKLTLTLGTNTIVQTTDSSGKYSVVLPSPNADASMGEIAITATGYQPFTNSVELKPGDNYSVLPIDALTPPAVPSPTVSATDPVVPAAPPPVQPASQRKIAVMRQLPQGFIKARTDFFKR
jgi:hypothetical protein